MDPNENIKRQHELAAAIIDHEPVEFRSRDEAAEELAELVQALDRTEVLDAIRVLYVVEVFERNDGIYLFQREEDAKAFEAAVNGDSLYTLPRCNLLETPVITHEMSVALIAAESEA